MFCPASSTCMDTREEMLKEHLLNMFLNYGWAMELQLCAILPRVTDWIGCWIKNKRVQKILSPLHACMPIQLSGREVISQSVHRNRQDCGFRKMRRKVPMELNFLAQLRKSWMLLCEKTKSLDFDQRVTM